MLMHLVAIETIISLVSCEDSEQICSKFDPTLSPSYSLEWNKLWLLGGMFEFLSMSKVL